MEEKGAVLGRMVRESCSEEVLLSRGLKEVEPHGQLREELARWREQVQRS